MKKILAVLLALMMIGVLASCGAGGDQEALDSAQASNEDAEATSEAPELPKIGLALADESAFSKQLEKEFQALAGKQGYELVVSNAKGDETAQPDDVEGLIGNGIEVLIILPASLDNLEDAMQECEVQDIKVLNLMEPINSVVNSLISPDYSLIGRKGARLANEAVKDNDYKKGNVYLLLGPSDGFIMQLEYDGFMSEAEQFDDVSVDGYMNFDVKDQQTLKGFDIKSLDKDINVIYAENSTIAEALLPMIKQSGRKISVITVGGEKDIIKKVKSKELYASMVVGPAEIAKKVFTQAVKCQKDTDYKPESYIEIEIGVASESTVDKYLAENRDYVEIVKKDSETSESPQKSASTKQSDEASPSASIKASASKSPSVSTSKEAE